MRPLTTGSQGPEWQAGPIEGYGLIGDTRTAALTSSDGAIDWMCVPRFDSPPVFGRLVGGAEAGTFRVAPAEPARVISRHYRSNSATLETTWQSGGGRLTLTEGLIGDVAGRLLPSTVLVRRVAASQAAVEVAVVFDPRRGSTFERPRVRRGRSDIVCTWGSTAIGLRAAPGLGLEVGVPTRVTVVPGQPLTFSMSVVEGEPLIHVDPEHAWDELEADTRRWQRWCDHIDDDVPVADAVVRSLLTLRLLTYSPSGAPVAAVSASLPEEVGGVRNWDYRYSWPRDASIGVAAFVSLGLVDDARSFLGWLMHATQLDRPRLPALLTLHGRPVPKEVSLTGWPGYRNSVPVRFGNGAADQHQLDGYGWVVDAACLYENRGSPLADRTWRVVASFTDYVADHWREPDAGIWEERGPATHHVHSKAMGWLALDRAMRIATRHRGGPRRARRWRKARDELGIELATRGFDPRRNTYTRSYGSSDLDAALLLLPVVGLEPVDSPRIAGTIEAVRKGLSAGGRLLYRYPPGEDGLEGGEGAFLPCSFWLVQALAKTGCVDQAVEVLDDLVSLASPLGLYAEEIDPATGAFLGNFPQALTHAALVQASLAVRDQQLSTRPSDRGARVQRSTVGPSVCDGEAKTELGR